MNGRWIGCCIHLRVLVLVCIIRLTATFKQQGGCYFPKRWEGTWFQSGIRQSIIIEGSGLSSKGVCLKAEGDKFLVYDEKRTCYRCVVIHEKHTNVLQYKETFCYGRDWIQSLCSLINSDALLFSMFRENAAPIPCPFYGSFTFTYNRGHGECRTPVSSIDTCTEDSKLLLSYQACPDVYGSESAVEELECLAMWKEGSSRYLVGKMYHNHATSNEDRFRCFVYEKSSLTSNFIEGVDYRISQSGDATCNGLFSATEGSRTMVLKRASSLNKCNFPLWLTNNNHWHTLDFSTTYTFQYRNSTLRITNSSAALEMKVVCTQIKQASKDEKTVIILAHFTMGCQSGFMCMALYRRDVHVVEIQLGGRTKRQEDACNPAHFNRTSLVYVTLVTSSPETRPCPFLGRFNIVNLIQTDATFVSREEMNQFDQNLDGGTFDVDRSRTKRINYNQRIHQETSMDLDCDRSAFNSLVFGCNTIDTMEFRAFCTPAGIVTSYSCHAQWEENGTNFLIASPLADRTAQSTKRFCFIYEHDRSDFIKFSSISGDGCDRLIRPGITGSVIFNVTNIDKCSLTSGSKYTQHQNLHFNQLLILLSVLTTALPSVLR